MQKLWGGGGGEAVEFDQNAGGGGCRRASFIMLEDIISVCLRGVKKNSLVITKKTVKT